MGSAASRDLRVSEPQSRKNEELYIASRTGDLEKVRQLLNDNAQANYRFTVRRGKTALHVACMHGHYDVVEELLNDDRCVVNILDIYGWSPLYYASQRGYANICELLISKGAELTGTTWFNETPLHIACRCNQVECVKLLLSKGARINALSNNRNTPIHLACLKGHKEVVSILLENKAQCNIINLRGLKPEWLAWEKRYMEVYHLVKNARRCSREEEPDAYEKDTVPVEENVESTDRNSPESIEVEELFQKYIQGGGVEIKSVKCVFSGPPKVGKTVFLQRLLGNIDNLSAMGNKSQKSTGFARPIVVPLRETQEVKVVQFTRFQEATIIEEGGILMHHISKDLDEPPHKTHVPTVDPCSSFPNATSKSKPRGLDHRKVLIESDTSRYLYEQPPEPKSNCDEAELIPQDEEFYDDSTREFFKTIFQQKGIAGIDDLEESTLLYLIDTGGQPEFHELLPLILHGPAFHLIFFNASESFDQPVIIQYRKEDGDPYSVSYETSSTSMQMITQLLSSLYSTSQVESDNSKIMAGCSKACLFGTYMDQLKGDKEKVTREKGERLRKEFEDAQFYARGFLGGDKDTVFLPVDNMNGKADELERIKSFLHYTIKQAFTKQKLPYSWLLMHLMLRHQYAKPDGFCTMEQCKAVACQCGVSESDVPKVLKYIHTNLGTVLHYAEVDGLRDLVICDPNVLFHMITNLVIMAFGGSVESIRSSAEEIRKTGVITDENIKNATIHDPTRVLKTQHLLNLLIHYNAMREIAPGRFFMPCLLMPNHEMDKIVEEEIKKLTIPPLLVRFQDGYIPAGMFSGLVVSLSRKWQLHGRTQYRNCVTFMHDVSQIMLLVRPTFFEIRIKEIKEESEPLDLPALCSAIYQAIEESANETLQSYAHTKNTEVAMGVYCHQSFTGDAVPHPSIFVAGRPLSKCPEHAHATLNPPEFMWVKKHDHPAFSNLSLPSLLESPLIDGIGSEAQVFATLLLNDKDGSYVSGLAAKHQGDSSKILFDVLGQWMRGRGKSRTWDTIIECLHSVKLNALAEELMKAVDGAEFQDTNIGNLPKD